MGDPHSGTLLFKQFGENGGQLLLSGVAHIRIICLVHGTGR